MATVITANRSAQRTSSLKEWMVEKKKSFNKWLSDESEFYSRICEFPVTRRTVVRMNVALSCLLIGALMASERPFVAVIPALLSAWLVYRQNMADRKGGEA